jgi:hypothetical protein
MKESVSRILDQVHENMNELPSEKVENEEEIAARAHLQQIITISLSKWVQVVKDLQAVKAKHGLLPKFE